MSFLKRSNSDRRTRTPKSEERTSSVKTSFISSFLNIFSDKNTLTNPDEPTSLRACASASTVSPKSKSAPLAPESTSATGSPPGSNETPSPTTPWQHPSHSTPWPNHSPAAPLSSSSRLSSSHAVPPSTPSRSGIKSIPLPGLPPLAPSYSSPLVGSTSSTRQAKDLGLYIKTPGDAPSPTAPTPTALIQALSPHPPERPPSSPIPAPRRISYTSGVSSSTAAPDAPPSTILLCTSSTLPRKMQRPNWSLSDYAIFEKMYTGYASIVSKAWCKRSGEVVCLKQYNMGALGDLHKFQIYREIKLHSGVKHEHIIHLLGAFQQGDQVVMVQEYAEGGDLFLLLHRHGGKLAERQAVELVLQPFLLVLNYLHQQCIAHRDLKPENILFTRNNTLKLCDFGLAIDMREERAVTRAGTLEYMAPEVLNCPYKVKPLDNKDNSSLHYSTSVDSWAVGILTYELLMGLPPFSDSHRPTIEEKIRTETPKFHPNTSELARNFITLALQKEPHLRPTVLELLHHPWIHGLKRFSSMSRVAAPPMTPRPSVSRNAGGAGSRRSLCFGIIDTTLEAAAAAATAAAAASAIPEDRHTYPEERHTYPEDRHTFTSCTSREWDNSGRERDSSSKERYSRSKERDSSSTERDSRGRCMPTPSVVASYVSANTEFDEEEDRPSGLRHFASHNSLR